MDEKDHDKKEHSSSDGTYVGEPSVSPSSHLKVDTNVNDVEPGPMSTASSRREQATRFDDDLQLMQAERVVSQSTQAQSQHGATSMDRSRSHRSHVDEFDEATNPLHEKTAVYTPPESPRTKLSAFVKKVHESSFIVRYLTYIVPVVLLLLIPLLVGALEYTDTDVGGVQLMWFAIWLEIVWLTLWAARLVGKCIPPVVSIVASIFTNNAKKWRDMAKQLEVHFVLFFWWLAVEISFLPTMKNHHVDGDKRTRGWEGTLNKLIIVGLVWTVLNLVEKFLIQLIAMSFHRRTYDSRIQINKFQIGSLSKLYQFSRSRITEEDEAFEQNNDNEKTPDNPRNPLQYATKAGRVAQKAAKTVGNKVGDVAGGVVADFTGKKGKSSSDPHQVILALLRSPSGSQVLARRLYRTFVRDGFDTVFSGDLKEAFDDNEEAEAAFSMFDRDMNGDISMEELEAVCVDIGRERKSITASLKDLDSVVSKLDQVFMFFVFIIIVIVFLTLISTSAAGVLTSAGSTILALSWMFSTTATEFLQSIIFVFVKHPFDVGDRVTIYGNAGDNGLGDDYFVKEIALLYTEFKKMQGHIVQAPNSVLNNLFILNQRRTGPLAEALPIVIKYGTTVDQMERLRQRLVEFVRSEKRDFQNMILTELREVTENLSLTLNVVFFYKSNWQNELLRLQRRNKFICMLMVALQEIGIEGPRMNLQGYTTSTPFHVAYSGAPPGGAPPPTYQDHDQDRSATTGEEHTGAGSEVRIDESQTIPENSGTSSGVQPRPSILRRGMDTAAARSRGEPISRNKHVDFSLGMSDISSNDIMGDVFEDRGSTSGHVDEVVRNANKQAADRRMQEIAEEERHSTQEARSSADGRSVRSGTSSARHRFGRRRGSVSRERGGDIEAGSARSVRE
ncbi:hypothetical protein ASPSYDRAFT_50559 [Aspergillus sydowii CBS 593.65]|uniref:Mechanosensitive ion channel protein n=1 Tax=Aspergillus sydowii CBS 593.65 TaxID=1036612 RepID=A0A1L9T2Z0_9EURO|nr:uncharacterized protein ASPSYDRAFT_50559 [Aspergillus sydowii CBS 593.65]OJJ53810.1 hypothetical protein ASPSYDRAFT_50559 [Aspergillus sydowii CBS 593.65]